MLIAKYPSLVPGSDGVLEEVDVARDLDISWSRRLELPVKVTDYDSVFAYLSIVAEHNATHDLSQKHVPKDIQNWHHSRTSSGRSTDSGSLCRGSSARNRLWMMDKMFWMSTYTK